MIIDGFNRNFATAILSRADLRLLADLCNGLSDFREHNRAHRETLGQLLETLEFAMCPPPY